MHSKHSRNDNSSLLINIQSRVLSNLSDLLTELFNQMDDAFFDLAENASNNQEQNQYFEAMRELRLHARDVDNRFRKELAYQFDLLQKRQQDEPDLKKLNDDLSLVEKDRVELDVAIGNMRHKLKTSYPDLLLHLAQRLNQYLDIDWLNESNHPLGTEVLINGFANALDQFAMPLKIHLMVLKYFERYVIDNLRDTLTEANKILANAGIQPQVKKSAQKPQEQQSEQQAEPNKTQQANVDPIIPLLEDAANDYTLPFDQVQAIMANFYRGSLNNRLFSVKQNQAAPELKMPDLLSVLAKLQNAEAESLLDDEIHSGQYDHQDMRLLLEHQLAHTARQRGVRKLRQTDDDVINLVSMVFEFILDDHNIPPEISVLLGRLQIPMIKVALADKQFFSDAHHPARRLLKLLSQAAIGWEKESVLKRDLLLEEIRSVVSRILNEFEENNITLFSELEKSFANFIGEETKRAEMVEKRVLQSAQGQAKREQARNTINQLINDRLQGKTLPSVVIDMIDGPWRVFMLQNLMRHGRDSHEWTKCLSIVDDLIWSIQPANAAQDRERWVKMIPILLKNICSGLEDIKHPGLEVDKFLSALWEIHGQILQTPPDQQLPNSRKVDHTITDPQGKPKRDILQPIGVALHTETKAKPLPQSFPEADPDFEPEQQQTKSHIPPTITEQAEETLFEDEIEEINLSNPMPEHKLSAIEKQRIRAAERKKLLAPEANAETNLRNKLLTLKPGQWIEVHMLDGKLRRCKLAFRDTQTDLYIFVSRRGNKVLETNLESLIRMVNADELYLLENVSIWDRALSSVLGSLSNKTSVPADATSD